MHYRLTIEYDGTDFHGWQLQPDRRTVQGTLEEALARLLGCPTRVAAAGRTDAGVHAAAQVVCFHSAREIPAAILGRALNALTPDDLTVCAVDVVDDDFDPRRAARSRRYIYRIWNRAEPSPFWRRYAWHVPDPLAVDAMDVAAGTLAGEHDFAAFRGADAEPVRSTVRRVLESRLARSSGLLVYRIEATAFLKHMVRNIVGTLIEVGRGDRPADTMRDLLACRDRTRAGATAPAHGLALIEVRY